MSRIKTDLAQSPHHPFPHPTTPNTMSGLTQSLSRLPNIAIIGAGVAGLRCASLLLHHNVNVTIFEARSRYGGRLHQRSSGGYAMDMGPNWIHGSKGNPIVDIAKLTGTTVMEPSEGSAVFDSQGKRVADDIARELSAEMWGVIVEAFKYSDENSESIDAETSLWDYFVSTLEKRIKDPETLRLALDQAKSWGPFVGDPVERQSLKFFYLEECIDDENVFVASTYAAILKEIARKAVEGGVIRHDTEVTHFNMVVGSVEVTTSTGEKYGFDEVVITCPLGWLKRHHHESFTPALPQRLREAIENISYGRLEKLYITFPRAWWMSSSNTPTFTHFHPPTYHPSPLSHPPSSSWSQNVVSLAHLPAPHAHPTLLFYLHGPCSTQLIEVLSSLTPTDPEYNSTLLEFAKPFFSLLPNYSENSPECMPTAMLCTAWKSDKYAGYGSYSNFQVGLEKGDEDIEVMRDSGGLWKGGPPSENPQTPATESESKGEEDLRPGGIFLAGEHTAPFVALGTTTGAYWSGEGVARRILEKWGIEEVEEGVEANRGNA